LYRVSGGVISVMQCIGCGAISTPQPCLGTCIDRRLDLVAAELHAATLAAVSTLQAASADRRRMVGRLAESELTPGDWGPLRARARAMLRLPAPPEPATVVTTWACDSCVRIEAPQPCIGVCVRPTTAMVPAQDYQAARDELLELIRTLERLAPPLRLLAWVRPRPNRWEASAAALRAAAEGAITGLP
jgi:hypothetical protein